MPQNHDIGDSIDIAPADGETITEEHLSQAEYHPDLVDYRKHGLTVTPDWNTNTISVDAGLAILQQDVTSPVPYRALDVELETVVNDLTLETTSGTNYVHLYVDPRESISEPPYGIHVDTDQSALPGADNLLIAEVDTANEEYFQRNTEAPLSGSGGGGGGGGSDAISLEGGDGPAPFNQHAGFDPTSGEEEIGRIFTAAGQIVEIYAMSFTKRGVSTSNTSDTDLVMRCYDESNNQIGPDINGNDGQTWTDSPPTSPAGDDLIVVYENTSSSTISATPNIKHRHVTQ